MAKSLRAFVFPFIAALIVTSGFAQNFDGKKIRFKNISIEEGLTHSSVECIIQDNRGFMWFGTDDGLNCYNGYSFKSYKNDIKNKSTLSSNYINCLYLGRNGLIWIGTRTGGLNSFNPQTGKFTVYRNEVENITSLAKDNVTCIYEDRNNQLWVGTEGGGLDILNLHTGLFEKNKIKHQKYNNSTLSDDNVTSICEDREGRLWIGTKNGLSVCDTSITDAITNEKTKKFKIYRHEENNPYSLSGNYISSLKESVNGIIWIGTRDGGLNAYNPVTEKFISYKNEDNNATSISGNDISTIYEDSNGNLWIGTYGGGLNIFNSNNKKFTRYYNIPELNGSLSNDFVSSIYEDISGNVWIGTLGGGLNIFNPQYNKFTLYQKINGELNSLSSNDISSIAEDLHGNLWIGTYGSGLNKYNYATDKYEQYKHDPKNVNTISDNRIYAILYDNERDVLWIGNANGLDAYNIKTKKTNHYKNNPNDKQSLSNNKVTCIYKDKSGTLWVGTNDGVNALNIEVGKFRRYNHEEEKDETLSNDEINAICEDLDGVIWIGTNFGLNALNPQTGSIKQYLHSEVDTTSISHNKINCIYEDKIGTLWIATGGGLNLFKPRTQIFECYTEHDRLPKNVIYGILEDKKSNLWLSTNYGLCRFTSSQAIKLRKQKPNQKINNEEVFKPDIKNYDVKNGIPSNEFNAGAFYTGQNGNLFFGGLKGVVSFHPDSLEENTYMSPVYITSLKLFGKEYEQDTTIGYKRCIHLNYDTNNLSFEFVTLNYVTSEKNEYAYKMEGLDKDWIYIGKRNDARYTSVPPGEYTFRVKASNNDGLWNEEGASIKINIKPPIWKTIWAYIMYTIITSLSIVWYVKARERSLTLQKKILEKKVSERTRQLKKEKDRVEEVYLQIDSKNKEITDSIKYAKRLQEAILQPEGEIKVHLSESFILYKPKDIVSGDFYYFDKISKSNFVIAAVDCTGHGVPGAFMSILGNNLLNQTIIGNHKVKPSEILDELNKGLSETLRQTLVETSVKDGMDIALCMINSENYKIQYAGAYNPLWIVGSNIAETDIVLHERAYVIAKDLIEIRADKFPVGAFIKDHVETFTNHEIQLRKGDTIYIFSDGYADQFGGSKGKKFKYKRFQELLVSMQDKPMVEQKELLEKGMEQWRGELEQVDDILVIGVRLV